jgi:ubiquinone/menaquinone biosynthesis C-methylase UbiE
MPEEVGREAQYELIAAEFDRHAADGFYNAHYDRPACLSLLGDVTGLHVLDAACGPGLYAEELHRRGAQVTGFDQSPAMVKLSHARVPDADFRVHDAADPLSWVASESVDVALLALALEYIDDRVAALAELHRVLRPWGALVLSRTHPTGDWLRQGGSYFDVRVVEEVWHESWPMRYWLAPLERTCDELRQAGFLIEQLIEPRPVPQAEALRPETYRELHREPRGFLAIRALARK